MTVSIPARSFAAAAKAAAMRFSLYPSDLFGGSKTRKASRASCLAIAGMIKAYPTASNIGIARGFGYDRSAHHLASMLTSSRAMPWWDNEIVDQIALAIKTDLIGPIHGELGPSVAVGDDGSLTPTKTAAPPRYQPPKRKPARIISPSTPSNVTAALLGDPPPGRREYLAALDSPRYAGAASRGKWAP